ncbi:T9SS type A sorting domain-containing protein [bacterium]|nr:T9SS type A sorting domain-containing protein [bacterium]
MSRLHGSHLYPIHPFALVFFSFMLFLSLSQSVSAQWESHGPPGLQATAVHGAEWDANLIFVGTANNGLYRLERDTGTWTRMNVGSSRPPVVEDDAYFFWSSSTVLDTASERSAYWGSMFPTHWVGTNEAFPDHVFTMIGNHLYHSDDAGETWEGMGVFIETRYHFKAPVMNAAGLFYVDTNDLAWRYDPLEEELTQITNSGYACLAVIGCPSPSDTIFASLGGSFSISENGGEDWPTNVPLSDVVRRIEVDESTTDAVWVLTDSDWIPWPRLWHIIPSTLTATSVTMDLHPARIYRSPSGNIAYHGIHEFIRNHAEDPTVADTLAVSYDGPAHLAPQLGDATLGWVGTSEDSILIASLQDQVIRDETGNGTRLPMDGTSNSTIWDLAPHPFHPDTCYAAGLTGLFRTYDAGNSWEKIYSSRVYDVEIAATDSLVIHIATYRSIAKSSDGGDSWTTSHLAASGSRHIAITAHPTDPLILWGVDTTEEIIRSTDGGESWVVAAPGLEATGLSAPFIEAGDPDHIYVGSYGVLHFSLDGGTTWYDMTVDGAVRDIAVMNHDRWILFVSTSDALLYRYQIAGNWLEIGNTAHNRNGALQVDPAYPGILWFLRLGAGLVWASEDSMGFFHAVLTPDWGEQARSFSLADERIYYGTTFQGVYTTSGIDLDVEEPDTPAQPSSINLATPWPNPFNSTVQLEFVLPSAGEARVVVYDIQGRLVQELLASPLAAGEHRMAWQPDGLASGVYLVQLRAGNASALRKVVYVK